MNHDVPGVIAKALQRQLAHLVRKTQKQGTVLACIGRQDLITKEEAVRRDFGGLDLLTFGPPWRSSVQKQPSPMSTPSASAAFFALLSFFLFACF